MFAQFFPGQRKFFRLGQRHRGINLEDVTFLVARDDRQRLADQSVNFDFNRPLKPDGVTFKRLTEALVEFGIARLPDFIAVVDAQKVHITVAEAQFCQLLSGNFETRRLHFVNAPAFLLFIRPSGVEHNAVAGFDGCGQIDDDAVADNLFHLAEKHTAFFAETGVDEFLIVRAVEPAGEQSARKGHFHFVITIYDFGFTSRRDCGA